MHLEYGLKHCWQIMAILNEMESLSLVSGGKEDDVTGDGKWKRSMMEWMNRKWELT